jgi:hypothetical protein
MVATYICQEGLPSNQPCPKLPSLVRSAVKRLKAKAKTSLDSIPPIFFTECGDKPSYPLSLLFTFDFEKVFFSVCGLSNFLLQHSKK